MYMKYKNIFFQIKLTEVRLDPQLTNPQTIYIPQESFKMISFND